MSHTYEETGAVNRVVTKEEGEVESLECGGKRSATPLCFLQQS